MKKIVIVMIAVLGFGLTLQAQDKEDFMSKRGVYILPESGDIGLGFDAVPFLDYMGNMFNGTAGNSVFTNFINNQAIVGKYYLSDDAAVRGELRLGFGSLSDQEFIMKDLDVPDADVLVTDKMKFNTTNVHLGAGYEMRRGHGRIQGYYGGLVTFQYSQNNTKYIYGNPITADFNSPNSTNFGGNITTTGRLTEINNLTNIGVGLRAFVGVEYFFAPKLSLGGEFGWGPAFNVLTDGTRVEERWTGTEVETQTTDIARDTYFSLDTDRAFGNIFLIFHF